MVKKYEELFGGRPKRDAEAYAKLAGAVRSELRGSVTRKRTGASSGSEQRMLTALESLSESLGQMKRSVDDAIQSDELLEAVTNLQDVLTDGELEQLMKNVNKLIGEFGDEEFGA